MNVWERAGIRGYAQAVVARDEILRLRELPLLKLRETAHGQLQLAKDAFSKASETAWYAGLYIRFLNHVRWGPYVKQIQDAEESFEAGENAQTEAEKRQHYLTTYTVSRVAVSQIAKEAQFGETSFVYLIEDAGRALVETAKPYVQSAAQVSDGVLTAAKWGLGIGLALLLLREMRR